MNQPDFLVGKKVNVECSIYNKNGVYDGRELKHGIFCGFGTDFEELPGGLAHFTAGIILFEDGSISLHSLYNIKFPE